MNYPRRRDYHGIGANRRYNIDLRAWRKINREVIARLDNHS